MVKVVQTIILYRWFWPTCHILRPTCQFITLVNLEVSCIVGLVLLMLGLRALYSVFWHACHLVSLGSSCVVYFVFLFLGMCATYFPLFRHACHAFFGMCAIIFVFGLVCPFLFGLCAVEQVLQVVWPVCRLCLVG